MNSTSVTVNTLTRPDMYWKLASAQQPVAFFYNGIGDHLLILPTLRALAQIFPKRLRLVCDDRGPLFLFQELEIKEFLKITFSREGKSRVFDAVAVAGAVRPCDLFISLVPWKSPSLLELFAQLTDVPSIGFSPGVGTRLDYVGPIHTVDSFFRIAKALAGGIVLSYFTYPPHVTDQSKSDAQEIRRASLQSKKLLVVHGDTSRRKMWPTERFETVFSTFLERHSDFDICLVGQMPLRISVVSRSKRVVGCYNLSLATSFALIAQADLFLGVDSCMLHAADLCRIPSVGLFGPTLTDEWGLRFSSGVSIQGCASTDSIEVDTVLSAMEWALVNRKHSEVWEP